MACICMQNMIKIYHLIQESDGRTYSHSDFSADPRIMQDYSTYPRVVQDSHSDYSAGPRVVKYSANPRVEQFQSLQAKVCAHSTS